MSATSSVFSFHQADTSGSHFFIHTLTCGAILALPLLGNPWSSSTYVEYEKTQTVRVS